MEEKGILTAVAMQMAINLPDTLFLLEHYSEIPSVGHVTADMKTSVSIVNVDQNYFIGTCNE